VAFCPNCGAQQPDGTAACSKCNTPMGDATGPAPGAKFKGTMMMGGASAADVEAMVAKAKAAAQASQAARTGGQAAPPRSAAPSAPPPGSSPSSAGEDAMAYQATIMGPITSPKGGQPEFPHPFGAEEQAPAADAALPTADDDADDPIHSAPTMGLDTSSEGGGPTIVDGGPPGDMGGFTDERVSLPVKGGKSGLLIVVIILVLVVLSAIGAGLYFHFRTPDLPQYPGYPMPGQVPGQVPGQYPGYPVPGQVPGQVPGMPQMPGVPPAQ